MRRVDLVEPARAIGRSTEEAMQSGMFYGYAGLITGLVSRLREEAPEVELVVATGGLARPMAALCTVIDAVEMDLTLHGLWVIWARHERMKTVHGEVRQVNKTGIAKLNKALKKKGKIDSEDYEGVNSKKVDMTNHKPIVKKRW